MQANGFDLRTARDYEAELLRLAAPVKVLPPRPVTRRRGPFLLLGSWRRRRAQAALELTR
jgi:hypothetical protein